MSDKFKPTAEECSIALVHTISGEAPKIWNPVDKGYRPMSAGEIAKGKRYSARSEQRAAHAESEHKREVEAREAELREAARVAREARILGAMQAQAESRKIIRQVVGH